MILSNLNDYCFIFEPNILKVVCQDITDPTKEVTLVSNGITLKRNCISSVCYFDMSVIFESYFTDTNFVLNYSSDSADPFYKAATFTISATDETTQTNVSKKLRWGAYQFDEVASSADFSFPFWGGMPLVLNSSKEHDYSKITNDGGDNEYIGVGLLTMFASPMSDFTYQTSLSSTKVQYINFVGQTCPSSGHYLCWVDSHGQLWHYMFYSSRLRQNTTEIKSGEMIPYYPLSLTDSEHGRSKLMSKEKQRSFNCFQTVEDSIYPIVESILSSPFVRYYVNSKWVGVSVKDMTVTPQKAGYVDIEFTIDLPQDFIQIR